MKFISSLILSGLLGLASLFGYQAPATQSFGAYNPTAAGTYRLQSSISSTQNTVTLTSFKEPVSNIKYTMSYLNSSIEYATIDPQNNTSKEFISFTGITQNADNTATLTGVTRGLSFSYPYTASTTLQQAHSGQAILILSNPPQLTNQYANKANDESITGLWTFTQSPIGINPGGQPNASETVLGVSQFATQIQMASSTTLGSTGGGLVIQSKYATSSPYTTGLYVPITRNDGKISPLFIATTSSDTYNFGGQVSLNSTTTIAATSANKLSLNSLTYAFPSVRAASSTVLSEDGAGNLSFIASPVTTIYDANNAGSSAAQSTTTILTIPIPANTLSTTAGRLDVKVFMRHAGVNNCDAQMDIGTGSATTTAVAYIASIAGGSSGDVGIMNASIYATSTASIGVTSNSWNVTGTSNVLKTKTVAVNVTNAAYIGIAVNNSVSSNSCIVDNAIVESVK